MNNKTKILTVVTVSLVLLFQCNVLAQAETSTPAANPTPTPNAELIRLEDEKKPPN